MQHHLRSGRTNLAWANDIVSTDKLPLQRNAPQKKMPINHTASLPENSCQKYLNKLASNIKDDKLFFQALLRAKA
jgi:hypothetical protein